MRDKGTGSVHYDVGRDRWVATVEAGRVDGKRRRLKATCRTEDDAKRELERLRAEAARNLPPDLTNLSCHGYLHWWVGQLDGLAEETVANYARHAGDWADWLGGLPLSALTPQHVKAGLTAFLHAGFAPGTVGLHRTTLHRAMKDAVAWGMADTNPVTSVSGPRQPDPNPSYLRLDQARTFIDEARQHPLGACWLTGLLTGARVSEVLGLTWDRVDLDAGSVRFSHQLKRADGGWWLKDLKTRKSRRAVAIPSLLVDLLTEHRDRQRQVQGESETWGNRWGLVFVTGPGAYRGPGAPLHISRHVTEPLKRLCETLGLGHVNYRSLRHTNATLLLAAGVDVRVVQERLGHSSSRVTSDVYTHVVGELQAEAADRLGRLFDS